MVARNRELVALALADRDDHHVARNELVALRCADLNARGRAVAVAHDALRCGLESKPTAVALRQLVLIVITRHVGLAAPVDDGRGRGAEPLSLGNRIDRGVTCADDDDALPDSSVAIRMRLQVLDERQRLHHARQIFARNAEPLGTSESGAY